MIMAFFTDGIIIADILISERLLMWEGAMAMALITHTISVKKIAINYQQIFRHSFNDENA